MIQICNYLHEAHCTRPLTLARAKTVLQTIFIQSESMHIKSYRLHPQPAVSAMRKSNMLGLGEPTIIRFSYARKPLRSFASEKYIKIHNKLTKTTTIATIVVHAQSH